MREERPDLEIMQRELAENSDVLPETKSAKGLLEDKAEEVLEKRGFVASLRRVLSKIVQKIDTNPENKPPLGKAF